MRHNPAPILLLGRGRKGNASFAAFFVKGEYVVNRNAKSKIASALKLTAFLRFKQELRVFQLKSNVTFFWSPEGFFQPYRPLVELG
jgi:hypothetical protein